MMTNRLSRTPLHVVKDADSSNDDVDDLECEVTDVEDIWLDDVLCWRRCDVVADITQQRRVVHRCGKLCQLLLSIAVSTVDCLIALANSSKHTAWQ